MKKKSAATKRLTNNPGKRPAAPAKRSRPGVLKKPTELSDRAKEEWDRVYRELDQSGRLSQVDLTLIKDHCLVVQRLEEAEDSITKHGVLTIGERGLVKNPACQIARDYRDRFYMSCKLLGLDPARRESVPQAGNDDDPGGLLD